MENCDNSNRNVQVRLVESEKDSKMETDNFSELLCNETRDDNTNNPSDIENFEKIEDTLLSKERKHIKLPKSEKPVKPKTQKKDNTDPKLIEIKEVIKSGDSKKLEQMLHDFKEEKRIVYWDIARLEFTSQKLDDKDNTMLHIAVLYDRISCIELLLRLEANMFAKNKNAEAPYALAKSQKAKDCIVDWLRRHSHWDRDTSYCYEAQIPLKAMLTKEEVKEKNKSARVLRKEQKREKLKKQKEEKEKRGVVHKRHDFSCIKNL